MEQYFPTILIECGITSITVISKRCSNSLELRPKAFTQQIHEHGTYNVIIYLNNQWLPHHGLSLVSIVHVLIHDMEKYPRSFNCYVGILDKYRKTEL
jgi:hypothetical protein